MRIGAGRWITCALHVCSLQQMDCHAVDPRTSSGRCRFEVRTVHLQRSLSPPFPPFSSPLLASLPSSSFIASHSSLLHFSFFSLSWLTHGICLPAFRAFPSAAAHLPSPSCHFSLCRLYLHLALSQAPQHLPFLLFLLLLLLQCSDQT